MAFISFKSVVDETYEFKIVAKIDFSRFSISRHVYNRDSVIPWCGTLISKERIVDDPCLLDRGLN